MSTQTPPPASTASPGRRLRELLARPGLVVAPGVFDGLSALLLARQPADAAYMTGFGVAASLGMPDAGLATLSEMAARVRLVASASRAPLIADADTGFGGLLNVRHAVRAYENAGAAAMQLEDQEFPKKCGHTPGRRVIRKEDMVNKIRVAVAARRDPDFVIIARTDARTSLGLDEAIARGKAYAAAGADVVFIESPESEAELERVGKELAGVPLLANMVEGGRTPVLPRERLVELGFKIAIYPVTGLLAAAGAMDAAYGHIVGTGSSIGAAAGAPLSFKGVTEVVGFPDVWAFEKEWADAEAK
ncbi:putative isocitrate lyase-family protein,putative carboxyvinyl-carboxyphosphonate phosphorylmutase [Hyaloraphidium curvatum]|nr:putative isocitrate lyase-family protein,putative carboxyvinyl-carboxyphosphonate phosphorylmutase [Hyaloraphidium curvatum]